MFLHEIISISDDKVHQSFLRKCPMLQAVGAGIPTDCDTKLGPLSAAGLRVWAACWHVSQQSDLQQGSYAIDP